MPVIYEDEPVIIFDRYRSFLLTLIRDVRETVNTIAFENPIKQLEKERKKLINDFPFDYKEATTKKDKKELKNAIDAKRNEIIQQRINQDAFLLSFLYIEQGLQMLFNDLVAVMGGGLATKSSAAFAPSISIKGNGEILIKGDRTAGIYISKAEQIGTPTPIVTQAVQIADILGHFAHFAAKYSKGVYNLVQEGKEAYNK